MYYYVDCPECKKDLSHLAETDNLDDGPIECPHCATMLRLQYGENFDEDMGESVGMFWFIKWEEKE